MGPIGLTHKTAIEGWVQGMDGKGFAHCVCRPLAMWAHDDRGKRCLSRCVA